MAPTNLTEALDRFKLGTDADVLQRTREVDALKFQVPDLCWPTEVKDQRKPQLIGGVAIPQRPMLSIPSLDHPIQLVLNAEKGAHLGITIHALSEQASDETAEVLQGLYRRIEVDSRASLARSWAFERAVKAGRGFYRVVTEPDPDSPDPFDQRICIKRILQQGAVVLDPFAQEPDSSDGRWAFLVNDMPWDTYKAKYPRSKMASFSEDELSAVGIDTPQWLSPDTGAGRAVRVAEYFRIETTTQTLVLLDDGTSAPEGQIPEGRTVRTEGDARSRRVEVPVLYWSVINAIEELSPTQQMDGRYIPIIPVLGRELIPFDQERRWVGMIEPNKDAVRLLNYSASSAVEMASLETKAPYTMVEGQEEGHEQEWQLANVRNFPYLRYRNVSLNGVPAPPPQRTQVDTSRLGPSMLLLNQAREFIHEGTGAYESALGQEATNAKSGRAVLALQNQHLAGSSHFLDNLAEVSLTYEAKVVLDLIPHIYDRPGRVARILDQEDRSQTVLLNQPFRRDPRTLQPQPVPGLPPGMPPIPGAPAGSPPPPGAILHYDLTKGRYGVSVSVGKSYKSRNEEGADELGNLFTANPSLFPILGDIYLKFRDFPGHLEAAARVKKLLPPPLLEQQGPDPQQLQQQLQQSGQLIEQLTKALDEKTRLLDTDGQKLQAQLQMEQQKLAAQTQTDQQKLQAEAYMAQQDLVTKLEIERLRQETQITLAQLKLQASAAAALVSAEQAHETQAREHQHAQTLTVLDAAVQPLPISGDTDPR